MSTNNKVFQVLVTKSNQAVLAKDKDVSQLAAGQIGVFNAETGLSVDATATGVKAVFLAVGNADIEKIQFSAGQNIEKNYLRNATLKDYVAPQNFVFNLSGYKALNDTDYALKLEFRNMQIYMRQGTNQFAETYLVTTSANEDVEPNLDLATKMLAELNNDPRGMFTAVCLNPSDNSVIADLAAFGVANPGVAPKIQVTANSLAILTYYGINPKYYYPRQTVIVPSLTAGFTNEAVLTVTNVGVAEQGNAYEIKQKEYKAGGWNGKPGPYRTSSHLGYPYEGITFNAVDGAHYLQIELVHDTFSTSGWGEYINNLMTTVAIPTGETTTINALKTVLNAVLGTSL